MGSFGLESLGLILVVEWGEVNEVLMQLEILLQVLLGPSELLKFASRSLD